jgi:hypothetical protein
MDYLAHGPAFRPVGCIELSIREAIGGFADFTRGKGNFVDQLNPEFGGQLAAGFPLSDRVTEVHDNRPFLKKSPPPARVVTPDVPNRPANRAEWRDLPGSTPELQPEAASPDVTDARTGTASDKKGSGEIPLSCWNQQDKGIPPDHLKWHVVDGWNSIRDLGKVGEGF